MMYFLDFDRTLFDTDAYNTSLIDHPACAPHRDVLSSVYTAGRDDTLTGGKERLEAHDRLSELMRTGALSFAPGELSRFVYPDVANFLRFAENNAIVITYGEPLRQRVKIESALGGIPRLTVLYTGDDTKVDYLTKWPGYHGAPAVLVDDRAVELELVGKEYPNMRLFEMRRDGGAGDGRWPVIRSLSELPTI